MSKIVIKKINEIDDKNVTSCIYINHINEENVINDTTVHSQNNKSCDLVEFSVRNKLSDLKNKNLNSIASLNSSVSDNEDSNDQSSLSNNDIDSLSVDSNNIDFDDIPGDDDEILNREDIQNLNSKLFFTIMGNLIPN